MRAPGRAHKRPNGSSATMTRLSCGRGSGRRTNGTTTIANFGHELHDHHDDAQTQARQHGHGACTENRTRGLRPASIRHLGPLKKTLAIKTACHPEYWMKPQEPYATVPPYSM